MELCDYKSLACCMVIYKRLVHGLDMYGEAAAVVVDLLAEDWSSMAGVEARRGRDGVAQLACVLADHG